MIVIPEFDFDCPHCGEQFGKEPGELAIHIGKNHDKGRGKN